MKRNNLTTAVVAGIAGIAGIASVSNAVNLNSDGVGQVLVYPYYTVNNGLNTLISVVNTTDEVKAVKVRFLEGKNSRECLDFNLYMSPYDVWVAALVPFTSTSLVGSYAGQESVQLLTSDTSCAVPAANGLQFLPWGFDPNGAGTGNYDNGGRDLQRCTEGHFEIIEMGVVVDTVDNQNAATAATHVLDGAPADCADITANWGIGTGFWDNVDPTEGITAPTGGLFGSASIIDVTRGIDVAYNADAIEGYSVNVQHTDPGNLVPNLGTGSSVQSNIFNNAAVQSDIWTSDSVQAVSALYMHNQVFGEYVLTDGIGANTEWVVTFPTKFAYVDPNVGYRFGGAPPYEPFTAAFTHATAGSGLATACEEYGIEYWDREEQQRHGNVVDILPSPTPPGIITTNPIFCWETNVLELHDGDFDDSLPSAILGSNLTTHYATQHTADPSYFDTGWLAITFAQSTDDNVNATSGLAVTYTGLPVTGFAVQRYVNASDPSGSKNYGGLFKHRYSKLIN